MPVRNWWVAAGMVTLISAALLPVVVQPWLNPKTWQDVQKESRKGIKQEEIQPGGMRVWSDPFEPRK
ncbi:small integral membrane protein 20-like [Saccoglossus kowalevskii]